MKKERLRVLDLLEQGKITAEEATRLLEVLKAQAAEYDDDNDFAHDFEDRMNAFSRNMDSFAKELGDKMSGAFKDVEPKVRNVTKHIISKTACVMDEISKSLNEAINNIEDRDCCGNGPYWEHEKRCCENKQESCCEESKQESCCEENKQESCCEESKQESCCEEKKQENCCDNQPREN